MALGETATAAARVGGIYRCGAVWGQRFGGGMRSEGVGAVQREAARAGGDGADKLKRSWNLVRSAVPVTPRAIG
jgi:hypothetical protein